MIRKRRNQKEMPNSNTEKGKNLIENQLRKYIVSLEGAISRIGGHSIKLNMKTYIHTCNAQSAQNSTQAFETNALQTSFPQS